MVPKPDDMTLGIIGGTGFSRIDGLELNEVIHVETPYGEPSAGFQSARLGNQSVLFLPRHGEEHSIPPHGINYRANLWAFDQLGVSQIIALYSVGSMNRDMRPGSVVLLDDLIDYTSGRDHTFVETLSALEAHVDMTRPYSDQLRRELSQAADDLLASNLAVYGATNGPRLETAAEIRRMSQDGCDVVGMTGMPEAALAREKGIHLAAMAVVVNWAAGFEGTGEITMDEIRHNLDEGETAVRAILTALTKADT